MKFTLGLLCSVTLAASQAWAAADEPLRLNGFTTLGFYHGDDPNASVVIDRRQGSGSMDDWRTDGDTMLGVQVAYELTPAFELIVQALSKRDAHNSYRPRVEWAYLSWAPDNQTQFRFGRAVPDVRLASNVRNVGYAQTMARPSELFYATDAITNIDGVTGSHRLRYGESEFNLSGFYGKNTIDTPGARTEVSAFYGAALRVERGFFTARIGASKYQFDLYSSRLADLTTTLLGLPEPYCTNCRTLMNNRGAAVGVTAHSKTLGLIFDNSKWTLQGEASAIRSDSFWVPNFNTWYVLASRNMGNVTPFVSYAALKDVSGGFGFQAGSAAPAAVAGLLSNLNHTRLSGDPSMRSWTMGVRWDPLPKLAVKVQWTRFLVENPQLVGSSSVVRAPLGNANFDGKLHLLSLTVDSVF